MWFGVSILIRGETKDRPPQDWLWEETIVVFDADSTEHAKELAARHGRSHEVSFTSGTGDEIHWVFDRVYAVCELDEPPVSGTEVFWHFPRAAEVASLLTPFD
jgi:hypothetical protein